MASSKRLLQSPNKSFFLFGPRATGKSTWLKDQIKPDLYIDLLKHVDFQKYALNLNYLREYIEGNPKTKVVVIDEIQKLPQLLDEVHSLIFDYKDKIQFILSGSSSRKIKRANINLLAGRAVLRNFHTFSCIELESKFNLAKALEYGMLPHIWSLDDNEDKKDYLMSYVQTYLKEEIQLEAAVRSLPSYLKFLEHFSLRNGQVINLQNISNEVGIPRTTINGYLDVLEQTLIGFKLEPIHLKAKVKEVSTPKFYFFDPGVVRALSQKLDVKSDADKGFLLETFILNELKIYNDYFQKRWEIFYWGTPTESEVDFIICQGDDKIGIEVKSSTSWQSKFSNGLKILLEAGKITKAYGVYLGTDKLKKDKISIFPVVDFIKEMHKKDIFK